ncbi:hypothetical protein SSX86_018206 [Deinandra increscens subsp. villosa]|uniref:non-specific serine/threonine protein kinase n=1 Tax=Deinandra increscens subsp. villosa TaxID=3103831 RepID=A0AAP0CRY9_9ASTR
MMSRQRMTCLACSSHIAIVMLFFTISNISYSYGGNNDTDYQALLKFKSMITKDPYGVLTSWNESFHFCDWSGVSCGKRHKRVTVVKMNSKGLEGSLSPHVGNLSFLRAFKLFNNSFEGTIPHELGHLSRLGVLDLSRNKFNGVIPTNLSSCTKLEVLDLRNNKLVGSIPNEISFLSKLNSLVLDDNLLIGGISPFIGNITSMETFGVKRNPLGGSIPNTLGRLKGLREIYFAGCNLNGIIPPSIYNLSLLAVLGLAENQLTGSLPPAFGVMLPHLVIIQLRNNQLSGLLPPSISNCSKLVSLEMNENNFIGKMSIDFANLRDIFAIYLGKNIYRLGEVDDIKFIDSLKNCTKLKVLAISYCNFQGVLPRSIGNLSSKLSFLDLERNLLHGNLPSSIGNLFGLTTLGLASNLFTGKIPSTIGMLKNLQLADFSENRFSGQIPDEIGNLSLLINFFMESNKLEGHIPSSLGNLHHLLQLELYNNKLNGKVPKELLKLSSLSIALDLSQNHLSGSLPSEVGELKMLNEMDLSENNLSGNIPSSLGGCTSLSFLSLSGNLFQGEIPSSLRSLRGIVTLDVSKNNLSGQIPRFLQQLSLEYLNLSSNDFEGEVPILGVFSNVSAFSVSGNSRLCGGLVELQLPKCKEMKIHKIRFLVFIIVILTIFTLFTISCLVYFWCKKKRKSQESQSVMSGRFLKVSYNQLLKATDGFSKANLIGEGGFSSVYKGRLDQVERLVAVKVLHLQNREAQRSFMRECEAWRSIRHRNLLKIITSCSSVDFQGNDFKALVYELMPNGSLHDWLHSVTRMSRLNLLQRMNILMNVACALDYLHNHSQTTIVHGDLKPSNILLDNHMVAHVGDYGLTRFIQTSSNQNSTTEVKGTIGYAPPEYGLGSEMTTSGDVYSFGILLLEVMTQKSPTDDIFNDGLNLHKFAYMALPDHVLNIVDSEILNFLKEDASAMQTSTQDAMKMKESMSSIVKIGVLCSVDSPPQRMNIENVVHELQHILDMLQNI